MRVYERDLLLLEERSCRPSCSLFFLSIAVGSVSPWRCHIRSQRFVLLLWRLSKRTHTEHPARSYDKPALLCFLILLFQCRDLSPFFSRCPEQMKTFCSKIVELINKGIQFIYVDHFLSFRITPGVFCPTSLLTI